MLRANRSSWSSLGRSGSSARGGDHARSSKCRALGEDHRLPTHAKARAFLENFAKRQIPITYQDLAKALQILPPGSIHRVTEALERLMEEDAAADRPFIAALAIRGAWRPTRARVLRLRPTSRPVSGRSGRSGRLVVSRGRAERRPRSLGRFAQQRGHHVHRDQPDPSPAGRRTLGTPADHNGPSRCPATFRSSGTTAASRKSRSGCGNSTASACPRRRTTRTSTSIRVRRTRSFVPTAGRGSVSILD